MATTPVTWLAALGVVLGAGELVGFGFAVDCFVVPCVEAGEVEEDGDDAVVGGSVGSTGPVLVASYSHCETCHISKPCNSERLLNGPLCRVNASQRYSTAPRGV